MRLINIETYEFEEFFDSQVPPYAILSHTWRPKETTFQAFEQLGTACTDEKIVQTCRLAKERDLKYAWIDTCCIDKKSSAELSEAINSMFRWYENAVVCFVHLADINHDDTMDEGIEKCRWRTRGWTLQELIGPTTVLFFDGAWNFRGSKLDLQVLLTRWTRVPAEVLVKRYSVSHYAVASKMAWASDRTTTRIEDLAYCLLGIFDVNMPLLYGEGKKAFRRLQEEIMKAHPDLTIFFWENIVSHDTPVLPLFAMSPIDFSDFDSEMVATKNLSMELVFTRNSVTISDSSSLLTISLFTALHYGAPIWYAFDHSTPHELQLPLRQAMPGIFVRDGRRTRASVCTMKYHNLYHTERITILLNSSLDDLRFDAWMCRGLNTSKAITRRLGIHVAHGAMPDYVMSDIVPKRRWDWEDRIIMKEFQHPDDVVIMQFQTLPDTHFPFRVLVTLSDFHDRMAQVKIVAFPAAKALDIFFQPRVAELRISLVELTNIVPHWQSWTNKMRFSDPVSNRDYILTAHINYKSRKITTWGYNLTVDGFVTEKRYV